jgi:hypothetical protein
MSIWDVEVIYPETYARMTAAERVRHKQMDVSWKRAAARSRDYREQGNLDKSYEWEDRASEGRANLFTYCKDIDGKYK